MDKSRSHADQSSPSHHSDHHGLRLDDLIGDNLPRLIAFIRTRMGSSVRTMESAHDIAQSVCRELILQQPTNAFANEASFRLWMFRQAMHKLVARHRYYTSQKRDIGRNVRTTDSSCDTGNDPNCFATGLTPSRIANAREQLDRIESGIAALPKEQGEAVMLVKIAGLSSMETAELLEKSDSAIRGLVARGLANLALSMRPT